MEQLVDQGGTERQDHTRFLPLVSPFSILINLNTTIRLESFFFPIHSISLDKIRSTQQPEEKGEMICLPHIQKNAKSPIYTQRMPRYSQKENMHIRRKRKGSYTKRKSFEVYHATNFSAACLNILAARNSCPCASSHFPSYIASRTAGK